MAFKRKPCAVCSSMWHSAWVHKPTASNMTQTRGLKPSPKPMKQIGKQAKLWIATKQKWLEANKAPYYFCHYCNVMMTRTQLTLDHMEARSRRPDLRHSLKNLVPCCWNCNGLKGSLSHDEYVHTCH